MGARISRTKLTFKLPSDIKKGIVINAYTTGKNINIEGYTGKIVLIDSEKELPENVMPCRKGSEHGGRAWIEIEMAEKVA